MDNWQECTLTCRGVMARQMPVNNQMGMGHERYDSTLGAVASETGFSEANHRAFYRRWAEVMAAPDWRALKNGHRDARRA